MLGAHYNGEAKSGYHNADNRVKAIHTKSGHKLIFTEDESILLTDKNKFKLESNNHLTCDKPYRKVPEPYVVTQIRRNIGLFKKKDGKEEIKKIRIENLKEEL